MRPALVCLSVSAFWCRDSRYHSALHQVHVGRFIWLQFPLKEFRDVGIWQRFHDIPQHGAVRFAVRGKIARQSVIHRVKLPVERFAGSMIRNILMGRRVAFVEPFAEGRLAGFCGEESLGRSRWPLPFPMGTGHHGAVGYAAGLSDKYRNAITPLEIVAW